MKRKVHVDSNAREIIQDVVRPQDNRHRKITIPAEGEGTHRYLPRLRTGSISGETFCKDPKRRRELGLPVIFPDP